MRIDDRTGLLPLYELHRVPCCRHSWCPPPGAWRPPRVLSVPPGVFRLYRTVSRVRRRAGCPVEARGLPPLPPAVRLDTLPNSPTVSDLNNVENGANAIAAPD